MILKRVLILMGLMFSLSAYADEGWVWVHIEDSKGNLLFGTTDGQSPSIYPRDNTANTPKFQMQLNNDGIRIRDSQGRYLLAGENNQIVLGKEDSKEYFHLLRHYDGTVSFIGLDKTYLYVDDKGDVRRTPMSKATPQAIFTIVELASKLEGVATKKPTLDCTPETIQQIRRDFGKVYNNPKLKTTTSHQEEKLRQNQRN